MTITHDQPVSVHRAVPGTGGIDNALALLAEGYRFIGRRCERLGSDIFTTRIMLRQAVCMRGPEAARLFYTPDRFTRKRAIPPTVLMLLQDFGSAETLDAQAHQECHPQSDPDQHNVRDHLQHALLATWQTQQACT